MEPIPDALCFVGLIMLVTGAAVVLAACAWITSACMRYLMLWLKVRGMLIEYFIYRDKFLRWYKYRNPDNIYPAVDEWSESKLRRVAIGLRSYSESLDRWFPDDKNPEAQIDMRALADWLDKQADREAHDRAASERIREG